MQPAARALDIHLTHLLLSDRRVGIHGVQLIVGQISDGYRGLFDGRIATTFGLGEIIVEPEKFGQLRSNERDELGDDHSGPVPSNKASTLVSEKIDSETMRTVLALLDGDDIRDELTKRFHGLLRRSCEEASRSTTRVLAMIAKGILIEWLAFYWKTLPLPVAVRGNGREILPGEPGDIRLSQRFVFRVWTIVRVDEDYVRAQSRGINSCYLSTRTRMMMRWLLVGD